MFVACSWLQFTSTWTVNHYQFGCDVRRWFLPSNGSKMYNVRWVTQRDALPYPNALATSYDYARGYGEPEPYGIDLPIP